jgi:hypothetical protein
LAIIHFSIVMLLLMYSMIGSLFRCTVHHRQLRSADASELKRLLHLQVGQTFDFQNAAGEDVLLALLGNGQQTGLDGVQRNRIDQITQGDAGCILPLKRTSTLSGMSSGITPVAAPNATRPEPAGKLMPMGKRVWLSPPVPTVSGSSMRLSQLWMMPSPGRSGHTAAGADEVGQLVVHLHVHGLRISRGVAERLHHQIGAEAQAGQVFEFVAGHRAGGVLRAHEVILGSQ